MIEAFHDVRFPLGVSFGSTGGPEWRNEIVTLTSGMEKRNARWAHSRRHFDAGTGLRSLDDLRQVLAFFEARRGSLHAFRFRDPFDFSSAIGSAPPKATDQRIGVGDGAKASFQLVKHYESYDRPITRPVAGSVLVATNDVTLPEGEAFTVDHATGTVTLSPDYVPASGAIITAGFLFDVPARFDTDRLTASIASFQAGEIPSIPIIEVKI
ncbi:TIGR02217 family protein [Brucella anthropi]|uniref:TIGR02217 family protein n=1 Tax=Brucella anthropi TaxID=529 RepID=UPI00124D4EB4|nr:TIGR02217 family protein [Brucella anthropi]KAB2746769.1 TIGR02217 family protein [Brucella anthropi]KAB2777229.1 TIGR02217 family protein [Brucella anthropi]UGQ21791.1 TIGR02217 family protein [Brucella anthropi]